MYKVITTAKVGGIVGTSLVGVGVTSAVGKEGVGLRVGRVMWCKLAGFQSLGWPR